MPKPMLGEDKKTNIFVWFGAIVCAILAIVVTITGIVIFIVYMITQPRVPYFQVVYAHLDRIVYDQYGQLSTQLTINIAAVNHNEKAHARFTGIGILLRFQGIDIAQLRADDIDIPKNSTIILSYVVPSSQIPLEKSAMDAVDKALKKNRISFDLNGQARTRWKVGVLVSVKYWTHLSCQLQFAPFNGSSENLHCSSKSH